MIFRSSVYLGEVSRAHYNHRSRLGKIHVLRLRAGRQRVAQRRNLRHEPFRQPFARVAAGTEVAMEACCGAGYVGTLDSTLSGRTAAMAARRRCPDRRARRASNLVVLPRPVAGGEVGSLLPDGDTPISSDSRHATLLACHRCPGTHRPACG